MGNSDSKTSSPTCNSRREKKSKSIYSSFSEFSLVNFASNLSGRSFASGATQHSTTSTNRPWSRVSRHRWRQSTLSNPLEASKTAWPVSHIEALFLPEFKIKDKSTFNFELVGTIAKGAFGKVYKVLKVDSNEIYAMKVLSKARIISENAIQQVKDEVRIQSMCGHNPFIVNCPYFWQTRKKLFIVSNFVSGGELLSLCQMYGSLPEELVAIYVAEIALALDFLHNSGVIYRDLKLENVLLDEEGHTQLIDFGLAKWLPYNKRTSTICGTLQYMAPEILSLENGYGHAVDWWSLGVLTCLLITSKFPPVVMRRMAELNQARTHAEQLTNNTTKNQTSGCYQQICMTRIAEESDPTIHITEKSSIEEADFSKRPESAFNSGASRCDFGEEALTPSDVDYSDGARDLIQRLLNSDPQKRLRSLLSLQNIRFFKNFDFANVRTKKISPKEVLLRYYPDGPKTQQTTESAAYFFEDFDSIHI